MTSASDWKRARCSPSSGPTAPGSRRCCERLPDCTRKPQEPSPTTATRSRNCGHFAGCAEDLPRPEGRRLFPSLTLEENLQVGAQKAAEGPFNIAAVYDLFAWMRERRRQKVGQLSGGEQQAVAIARALVAIPQS